MPNRIPLIPLHRKMQKTSMSLPVDLLEALDRAVEEIRRSESGKPKLTRQELIVYWLDRAVAEYRELQKPPP